MSGWIAGVPAALDDYTRSTVPTLMAVGMAVEALSACRRALMASDSDVELSLPDRTEVWRQWVDTTRMVDEQPAAFAFALRALDAAAQRDLEVIGLGPTVAISDQSAIGAPSATAAVPATAAQPVTAAWATADAARHQADADTAWALAAERLLDPYASTMQVLDAAAFGVCTPLPEDPGSSLLPWYWRGIGVASEVSGASADALQEALRSVGPGGPVSALPRPGVPLPLAAPWLRAAMRVSGALGVGLEAGTQYLLDRNDPNITPGHLAARVAGRALIDGGYGLVGTAAGATAGAAAGPLGVAGVAILGGMAGSSMGRMLRGSAPVAAGVDRVGDALDRLLGTGHDDDYDETILGGDPWRR